jgi:cytochrome oxidase assembly protein ShyY1
VLDLLRTRRWIGFSALVVVVIVAFGALSLWQWARAEERRLDRIALQDRTQQPPIPIADVLGPGEPLAPHLEWRPVILEGRFDPGSLLVRRKPQDGRNGFWVMTRLVTPAGTSVWVNRGWIPTDDSGAVARQEAPAAPVGAVTVVGRLRPISPSSEPAPTDVPPGQVTETSAGQLIPTASYRVYIEQTAADPPAAIVPVAAPQIDEVRNISYAVQWLLFAGVAILGWWFFLRREAHDDAKRTDDVQAAEPSAPLVG